MAVPFIAVLFRRYELRLAGLDGPVDVPLDRLQEPVCACTPDEHSQGLERGVRVRDGHPRGAHVRLLHLELFDHLVFGVSAATRSILIQNREAICLMYRPHESASMIASRSSSKTISLAATRRLSKSSFSMCIEMFWKIIPSLTLSG